MSAVAVFDIGKTNVKLTVADPDGRLLETLSVTNPVSPGPPYPHHDLDRLEDWFVAGLADLATRHDIEAVVATGHGSGGILVGEDGPAMPMIDYEQAIPPSVEVRYRSEVGPFRDRGSPVMLGAAHLARQMLWLETGWPDAFATARHFLALPQYWSWRLSGVAASEVTSLGAQSHLWSAADGRPTRLAVDRGWARLLPPVMPAWTTLGPLRPEMVQRTGLGRKVRVINGIHDSSASFYRHQVAGLADFVLVSTGTWVVALGDDPRADFDHERPGFCCNADAFGRPVPCVLTMGGREFGAVAGGRSGLASAEALAGIVASNTRALPAFGDDDGLFPGRARSGFVEGPLAQDDHHRLSLAVLYAALLTDRCLAGIAGATVVLDGPFVRDPLYGALVAALNRGRRVLINREQYGTATGCALLAFHERRKGAALLSLQPPPPLELPGLLAYRDDWLELATSRRLP